METNFVPTKSMAETVNESRENFKNTYGRLLTEEEAITLTTKIKEALQKEGELDES